MPSNDHIARQKAQRSAVERIKQRIIISAKRFRTDQDPEYRVLVQGKSYNVGPRSLAFLEEGRSPGDVGLMPVEDDE